MVVNYHPAFIWYSLIFFAIIIFGFCWLARGKSSQKCDGLMENDDASQWRAFGSSLSAQEISGESIRAEVASLCSSYNPDASIAAALSGGDRQLLGHHSVVGSGFGPVSFGAG